MKFCVSLLIILSFLIQNKILASSCDIPGKRWTILKRNPLEENSAILGANIGNYQIELELNPVSSLSGVAFLFEKNQRYEGLGAKSGLYEYLSKPSKSSKFSNINHIGIGRIKYKNKVIQFDPRLYFFLFDVCNAGVREVSFGIEFLVKGGNPPNSYEARFQVHGKSFVERSVVMVDNIDYKNKIFENLNYTYSRKAEKYWVEEVDDE
jgi:hypothetical protein